MLHHHLDLFPECLRTNKVDRKRESFDGWIVSRLFEERMSRQADSLAESLFTWEHHLYNGTLLDLYPWPFFKPASILIASGARKSCDLIMNHCFLIYNFWLYTPRLCLKVYHFCSREKLRPEEELLRARNQIHRSKLAIRGAVHELEIISCHGGMEGHSKHEFVSYFRSPRA